MHKGRLAAERQLGPGMEGGGTTPQWLYQTQTSQGRVSLKSRHLNLSIFHLNLNPTYRSQSASVDKSSWQTEATAPTTATAHEE